jgi:N-acetylmuramoyl-L-alanine amidase
MILSREGEADINWSIMLRLQTQLRNISILQYYARTNDATEEVKDRFYLALNTASKHV